MVHNILITIILCVTSLALYPQDFYIKDGIPYNTYYTMPSNWVNLNLNEGRSFLTQQGFTYINTTTRGNKVIVAGEIKKDGYVFARNLSFENELITGYIESIHFIHYCHLCFVKEVMRKLDYTYMPSLRREHEEELRQATRDDAELREVFYRMHAQSLKRDGIEDDLMGEISDVGFRFENLHNSEHFKIHRLCQLSLAEGKLYEFFSSRTVLINEVDYFVDSYDLSTVNQYDLPLMVEIFLLDCANHGISIQKQDITTTFEPLEGDILGLSYGIYNDDLIKIRIDPEKWANASTPKRWYLLYHELGHDVLNLEHGTGGKMMFNFSDRGYSWEEFWNDREYMFNAYKRMHDE